MIFDIRASTKERRKAYVIYCYQQASRMGWFSPIHIPVIWKTERNRNEICKKSERRDQKS